MSKQRRNGWRFSRIRKQRTIIQPTETEPEVLPEEPAKAEEAIGAEPEAEVTSEAEPVQEKTEEEPLQEEETAETEEPARPEEKVVTETEEPVEPEREPAEETGWLDDPEPAVKESIVPESGWLDDPEPAAEKETGMEELSVPEEEAVTEPEESAEAEEETAAEPEESAEAEKPAAEPEETAEPEEDIAEPEEETAEPEPEPEMEIVPEENVEPETENAVIFGEETSAARELPARFFDEEDVEDAGEARKKEKKRKKKGKKKPRVIVVRKGSETIVTKPVNIGDLTLGDGIPKICIPVIGRTREEILEQAVTAQKMQPDLVEWRADLFGPVIETEKTHEILKELKEIFGTAPLLFTYRTESEGGFGRISWEQYAGLLVWAAGLQEVDLIDVEAMGLDVDTEGLIRAIHDKGTPVIASVHYCDGTPDKKELREAIRFLRASDGDIIKLAAAARTEKDVLDLMTWTHRQVRKIEQPLITVSMGDVGRLSRVSGGITGSAVTFGCAGEASAPGQIPASGLREILEQLGT